MTVHRACVVALPRPTKLAVPRVVSEGLSWLISQVVDAKVSAAAEGAACPAPPIYPPEVVDLRQDTGIALLDIVLNDVLGGTGNWSTSGSRLHSCKIQIAHPLQAATLEKRRRIVLCLQMSGPLSQDPPQHARKEQRKGAVRKPHLG